METIISEADFRAYVVVQMSGCTNMFNTKLVEQLALMSPTKHILTQEVIYSIMERYEECIGRYKDFQQDLDVKLEAEELQHEYGHIG